MIGSILKGFFPTAGAVRTRLGHDSLIHCIEARRGRGKSYLMTNLVLDLAVARTPMWVNTTSLDFYRLGLELVRRRTFSTLIDALDWLAANVHFIRTWDDLFTAYDGVVILDEAVRHLDSRPGMAAPVPKVFWEWGRQTRKLMMTVYLITHSVEYLDNRASRLLDVFWQVRKVADPKRKAPDGTPFPVRFHAYGNDPGGAGKVDNVNRLTADLEVVVPFSVRVAKCYESRGLIREIVGDTDFPTVKEIHAWHAAAGHAVGVDGEELLHRHRDRLSLELDAGVTGAITETLGPSGAAAGAPSPQGLARPAAAPDGRTSS